MTEREEKHSERERERVRERERERAVERKRESGRQGLMSKTAVEEGDAANSRGIGPVGLLTGLSFLDALAQK